MIFLCNLCLDLEELGATLLSPYPACGRMEAAMAISHNSAPCVAHVMRRGYATTSLHWDRHVPIAPSEYCKIGTNVLY